MGGGWGGELRPATIRNILILVVERSISQNIRNFFSEEFYFFSSLSFKVHQVALYITNHLAKWLSVDLQTKGFWVRIPLLSFKYAKFHSKQKLLKSKKSQRIL